MKLDFINIPHPDENCMKVISAVVSADVTWEDYIPLHAVTYSDGNHTILDIHLKFEFDLEERIIGDFDPSTNSWSAKLISNYNHERDFKTYLLAEGADFYTLIKGHLHCDEFMINKSYEYDPKYWVLKSNVMDKENCNKTN